MRKSFRVLQVLVLCGIVAGLLPVAASANGLFFSEYIEGSSNNKALELFNATGSSIDLAAGNYQIWVFFNGGTTATQQWALTGTIASMGTYVVANSSAGAAILNVADQTTGSIWYNGDDAVALLTVGADTTMIDVIGQIGFDPGSEWGTGLQSTADNTLRRNPGVCDGDPDGSNVFDPSVEWTGFATDTFDGLDAHSSDCQSVAVEAKTWEGVKRLYR